MEKKLKKEKTISAQENNICIVFFIAIIVILTIGAFNMIFKFDYINDDTIYIFILYSTLMFIISGLQLIFVSKMVEYEIKRK